MQRAPTPSQRVLLAVRTIERTVGQARGGPHAGWAEAAGRYLRSVWVNHTLLNELRGNAVSVLNAVEMYGPGASLHVRLHSVVFPDSTDKNQLRTFTRGFARLAPEVLNALPAGSMEHRLARETAEVLTSPGGALLRLNRLGVRFDRLLARTERLRNALIHGTGTAERLLLGVNDFAVILALYAADEVMRQARTGKEPLD